MDHVDALREFGDIEDSMFESCVDADFLHTGSHGGHRLPVVRFQPLLDATQLEPPNAARVQRKTLEVTARRSQPK